MPDFSYHQGYLRAGLAQIEGYLLSDELFWPLNISASTELSYPSLTLGGLLLHQKFARSLAQTAPQFVSLQKLESQLEALRLQWRVAWERKATREFRARLRQWENVLREIRSDPAEHTAYYRYEVRWRVILELLRGETRAIDLADLENLRGLDLLLRVLSAPGDFIWEPELAPAFPEGDYWYLWGLPTDL